MATVKRLLCRADSRNPAAVWQNIRVEWIQPEDIPVSEDRPARTTGESDK